MRYILIYSTHPTKTNINTNNKKMIIFEIIGIITVAIIAIVLINKIFRYFIPYNWNNCPNDHDTMTRYGASICNKCGNEL